MDPTYILDGAIDDNRMSHFFSVTTLMTFQGFRLEILMFPFPVTGLRIVHDKKVHDAMERARIDAELARGSRRTVQLLPTQKCSHTHY